MNITYSRTFLTQLLSLVVIWLCAMPPSNAQQLNAVVPTLVKFSGTLTDISGKPLTGTVGVTIYLYKDVHSGAPLWMETQNVAPDKSGHYTVVLGSTTTQGLPTDLFASGEARWLGVQAQGQAEQPRVLLLSVPYALKAGDAQTVGGLPPSAFVLAAPAGGHSAVIASNDIATSAATALAPASSNVTTTGGTVNTIPMFTTATNLQNSLLTQAGTTTVNVGGRLNLPATGAATAIKGFNSRPESMVASVFNSGTSTAIAQTFQLQTEPAGNNTSTAAGTLNLLYASGTAIPAETGLRINSRGLITFATGQAFPGTGTGTVKSVGLIAPSTDFTVTGSPLTSTGKLSLAWNIAPTSADTANAIVKRDASGNFSASTINATTLNAGFANLASLGITTSSPIPTYFYSSATNADTLWGVAGSSTGNAVGVEGETSSSGGSGVYGTADSLTGNSNGVYGVANANGSGVLGVNTASGYGVLGQATGSVGQGVWGESSGTGFSNGAGSDGVHGVSHSTAGSGVAGINTATDATGVYGSDPNGYGVVTDSHVSQARAAGGWVKAMAYVDSGTGGIKRCFNSQLNGSAASTVPCGMTFTDFGKGLYVIDFGFQVDDRFLSVTTTFNEVLSACLDDYCPVTSTQAEINGNSGFDEPFFVVVF